MEHGFYPLTFEEVMVKGVLALGGDDKAVEKIKLELKKIEANIARS